MKMNFPGIAVVLAVLLILPCVSSQAKEQKGAIEGSVYSAETNQPIKDALVRLQRQHPKRPPVRVDAATDAAGKFLAPLDTGTYRYTVASPGFALFEGEVAVPAEAPVKLSIPLNREAVIQGRIVDPSGKPLSGVAVSVGKGLESVTDANGAFQIGGVDARGYEVRILHPRLVGEKPLFVSLKAGEKMDLGDITVRRSGTLIIKMVAGKEGSLRSIDRADVYLSGEAGNRWGRTNKKGEITFAGLPPGFYSINSYDERIVDPQMNVEVKEGKRSFIKLEAALRPPSLSFENTDSVFLPSRQVKLQLRGLWIDRVQVTLYSVDVDRFRAGSVDTDKPDAIPQDFLAKERAFTVALSRQRGAHSKKAVVQLPPLRPGIYVVDAVSGKTTTRTLFLVTRLGIVAKASPSGTLFYAVDLVDGKALQDVEIQAFSQHRHGAADSVFSAKTDANGLVEYGAPGQSVKIIGFKDGNSAFLNLTQNAEERMGHGLTAYLYTERPVYRPGQTVYFKGIVRKRVGEEYALPGLEKLRVTITDSQNQSVVEQDYAVNSSGSFNGEFSLPNNPSLGDYTLRAEAGQQNWQTFFSVREYRKPEFEVTLTSPHKFRVAGDTAELSLQARYYFGAPVAGAKVRYRIYSRPAYAAFPGDQEPSGPADVDDDGDYAAGYSDFLGEGEAVTDEKGQAKIPVSTGQTNVPLTYTIETDVIDIASRQVSASASFLVTPSLVALDIRSHSYLAAPGKPVEFSARTRTWDGKPVKTRVSVAVEEQYFDKRTHITSYRKVEQMEIPTDASGQGQFHYSFPRPGHWRVTAEASDELGRKSAVHEWVWVWREGHAWDSSYRELETEFDGKSYKPGQTARLIVRNPAAGASLLLTLEGREVYRRRVIGSAGSVEVVDIPVIKEYAPYLFVSTTVVANGRFYTRTKMLRVDHQGHKLDVTINPDKPVYGPGETVRLTMTATDPEGSKPRAAELSLAVVDEAIYAVSPEKREDIYRFFRGTREHLVMTLNSFPRVYLGGAPKAETAAPAAEEQLKGIKVRKVFRDTAFWMPILETDTEGRAAAEFVLPDNLTTWRVTAVGHTDESDFGTGRKKFISRLDVMAWLQPPRFFIQGDELKIPVVVNNMTTHATDVAGRFEAEGLTLLGEGSFSGKISAGGAMRRDFPVKAGNPGLSLLRIRAAAGERGDAMELEVPILPRAMERESRGNIVLRGIAGEAAVEFPNEALAEGSSLTINLAPTLAASLGESLGPLVDFPYGCVEQTMSRFLPAVYVRNLLGSGRFSLEKDVADKL
ncbi:MAG TPA: carboxypeptidase regulatory-like domain-containing protein, partial [Geobacteraceae bacterium]|nr:carboxypeptidase regulatory-like domain-containing protein [Geobacteraceae bacterium]